MVTTEAVTQNHDRFYTEPYPESVRPAYLSLTEAVCFSSILQG